MMTRIGLALALAMAAIGVRAQPPALSDVLDRAASYVATFERQLTGIAADETYVQSMGIPGRHGEFIPTTQRRLTATLLLMREGDEGYLEARDVRDVDGVPVRDRAGSLAARAASEAPRWGVAEKMQLRSDNARYNIGDIVRTINTPLLALQVLRRQNQSRFSFSPSTDRSASVGAAAAGDTPGVFRVSTDVWVIGFRERAPGTLIRTETGRDVPCRGRLWIDAGTGRVMMTEMIVKSRQVEAQVTVSFKSEPLLGLLPPIEMHELYRASGRNQTIVEASASYGPFHLTSQTRP
jgi:hypothetical protein